MLHVSGSWGRCTNRGYPLHSEAENELSFTELKNVFFTDKIRYQMFHCFRNILSVWNVNRGSKLWKKYSNESFGFEFGENLCVVFICADKFSFTFWEQVKKKLDLLPQNRVSTVLQNLELSGDFTSVFFFFRAWKSHIHFYMC